MQLLVSVSTAEEARAARDGGAHIVDAKDPGTGALGAVTVEVFRTIRDVVRDAPVSAALGEDAEPEEVERTAREFARTGAAFVKVGCAGMRTRASAVEVLAAALRGVMSAAAQESEPRSSHSGVVAVAFADGPENGVPPLALIDHAVRAGARGVLLDTIDKRGPGLRTLVPCDALERWVRAAHDARLFAAVAGRIGIDDVQYVKDTGADIVGVRGAVCEGGRTGRVVADRVRLLVART